MGVILFIGAIIWGSLSAQFLVQAITSLIIASICLAALALSEVPRDMNGAGAVASLVQAILFAALFIGGNWLTSNYIDYASWNAASIASLVAFIGTLVYVVPQVPGKILLARLSAWTPFFAQAAMGRPRSERVALARQYRASPTMETLYPSRK
jgi:hypothetical protein